MNSHYQPIDCSFHDELQMRAIRGGVTLIVYRDETGGERAIRDVIVDVYSRAGAEYLRLRGGDEIRLDRLLRVLG
jgi:Rho-binding antiterminator